MRLSLFLLASALGLPLLAAAMPGGRSPYFYRRADQEAMTSEIPIHASCNASQAMQLRRGIFDTKRLAREAADHLFKHGNTSELFQTYFGSAADPAVPIGIYERILEGDKTGTLLRCDDPDQNCATQAGWNGHWRGNNASDETVICDLSFHTRRYLETACSAGFQLGRDNVNVYWGADLLHRMMHLPKLTNEFIAHAADEHEAMLTLAKEKPEQSVKNQHTIQEFAFDAFTRMYINPAGCSSDGDHSSSSASSPDTSKPDAQDSHDHTGDADAGTSQEAGKDCHSHADGTVHCV